MSSNHGTHGQKPNKDKMRELILYICAKSQRDLSFGSTKLNKLLFYCDRLAYVILGKSMTGYAYERWQYGLCPQDIQALKHEMQIQNDLAIENRQKVMPSSYYQHMHMALRDPDLDLFSPYEIDIVNQALDILKNETAGSVSTMSHELPGWQLANDREIIPYAAFLHSPNYKLTADDMSYALDLSEEIAERL